MASLSTGIVPISLFEPLFATVPRILILLQPYWVTGPSAACISSEDHCFPGPRLSSAWGSVGLTLGAPTPGLCHLNPSQHHSPKRLQSLPVCHVLGLENSGWRPCCPSPLCRQKTSQVLPKRPHPTAACPQQQDFPATLEPTALSLLLGSEPVSPFSKHSRH